MPRTSLNCRATLAQLSVVLLLLPMAACGSHSVTTPATSQPPQPTGMTSPTTSTEQTTPSSPTDEPADRTDPTTLDQPSAAPSVAELDAICTTAHDAYRSTESSPSGGADPTTLQVKANSLLAAAATSVRAAGATELADALDTQVAAGKALAVAMDEGRLDTTRESDALEAAGAATAAEARALGSRACEDLGGL